MGPMYIETPYTYTEWAEIIGQSHGTHVYWDTLPKSALTPSDEVFGSNTTVVLLFFFAFFLALYKGESKVLL